MSTMMFAEPVSPWVMNDSDLDRLRRQLADAEARAARETDWAQRTRAEQDVKLMRRELEAAETERRTERARQALHRPPCHDHAMNTVRAVAEGRCLAPVPHFAGARARGTRVTANSATTVAWNALTWPEQAELVAAAMAEMRRVRAVR